MSKTAGDCSECDLSGSVDDMKTHSMETGHEWVRFTETAPTYFVRVRDKVMLAQHVADNPEWSHLIDGNMRELNGMARTQGDAFKVPGCELIINTVRFVRTA